MEGMNTTGITLGEAMSLCNNNGFGGSAAMWNNPFMYLMFMNMMNGGWGWGANRGNLATQTDVYAANDSQSMRQAINNLGNGLADVGYAITNNVKDGNTAVTQTINNVGAGIAKEVGDAGASVSKAVNDVGAGMAMGFCTTNHNIDNLKYENAKNTADIITNATANTQRIMDGICGLKMDAKDAQIAALTGQLADAKLNLSQVAQSAYLVEKLTPTA